MKTWRAVKEKKQAKVTSEDLLWFKKRNQQINTHGLKGSIFTMATCLWEGASVLQWAPQFWDGHTAWDYQAIYLITNGTAQNTLLSEVSNWVRPWPLRLLRGIEPSQYVDSLDPGDEKSRTGETHHSTDSIRRRSAVQYIQVLKDMWNSKQSLISSVRASFISSEIPEMSRQVTSSLFSPQKICLFSFVSTIKVLSKAGRFPSIQGPCWKQCVCKQGKQNMVWIHRRGSVIKSTLFLQPTVKTFNS